MAKDTCRFSVQNDDDKLIAPEGEINGQQKDSEEDRLIIEKFFLDHKYLYGKVFKKDAGDEELDIESMIRIYQ